MVEKHQRKKVCSLGVCRHLYPCMRVSLSMKLCVLLRASVCECVCACVLGAACEWEDLGGKSWSRKLLEVILWPTADNSFPPGAS